METRNDYEFEEICEQFMPMIYGLIRKWNLGMEKDEYIQTGRIALYEAWVRHDEQLGAFPAYAKSYVYGRIQQSLEKKERWNSRHVATEPFIMSETSLLIVGKEEELLVLQDWLSRTSLSPREKEWVREALFYGIKPTEIAESRNVSVSTVKTWRKTALKKLRAEGFDFTI
ncbi:sigma-70 family RNA polymerase sigma factor [Salipaludibacillus sp. CF4.18]|uniref:sigma-70 family RNA polymerase sigma factor n=1 Tax=Salipaludibacillus sp. CF4.18 TaxID=3373081 RepID=UPI003EE4FD6C